MLRKSLKRFPTLQRKFHLCIPFLGMRGLSPNFHIHVSVSDLYIPRISPHISCSRIGRSMVGIYKSLTDTWMWKWTLRPRDSFSGNISFEFSILVLGSVSNCPAKKIFYSFFNRTCTLPITKGHVWSIWPFLRKVSNKPCNNIQL